MPILKDRTSKNGCEEQHAKQAKHAKVQAARFPNKLKHAHSMPKFPKSFGPFREKLKTRTNFRKLMRTVMLNNFKLMLFPKERRFSQGNLVNFRSLVSKNRGLGRARNRKITNKTPKEKGERSTRKRVLSARRFDLILGFFPSVLQDPRGGFWSCQGRSWQGSPGTTAGLRSFRNRINLHRNRGSADRRERLWACAFGRRQTSRCLFYPTFTDPPSPSQMYDSLALCLTDRSFLTRVALGGGGSSQDLVGGATGVSGRNRLSRPEEYGEETPYVPPRPPRFPEEEPQQRPQQKLLIDQATITKNALEEWHTWLKMAKQGRSLREWGLTSSDVITAVEYLGEAPPQEEPARGGRWSNAPRGDGRKKQKPPQEYPTSVGTLLYLKKALKCIDCFNGSPSGYRGLLLGPSSAVGLEKPDGSSASDEREAWKYLAASVALRVQRLLDKKRAKNRMVDAMTAIWLQTPKAAAAKPRPVQPRTPTTPAEESSDSSSEGVSEVSGECCRVDRYPPLPWDRNAVAARGHYPGVWNTGFAGSAVSRGWCCSSFGRKECRRRFLFEPSGRYSCWHTGDGTAHAGGHTGYGTAHADGDRTEEPGEPGISYSPAGDAGCKDAFGVGWFGGTIASTSTCFTTTSTAAIEESVCAAPSRSFGAIKRANATGKGVYSPLAFGRSIFRAFGRHRFRNRNPIRRLRGRGRGRESGHGSRQSRLVNSFDVWFLKKKRTFCEHVWHEGFEWHALGMELGMNVSLICACFGSLGNPEALPSFQQSSNASYVYRRGCGHALLRAPLRLEPPEWYSFLVVFFGTSAFQEVVAKGRFEDQEVSCKVPPERELF